MTDTKQPDYRHLPLALAFILGSLVLLSVGFIGGREFEKVRVFHQNNWRDNYQRNFIDDRNFDMMRGRPMMPPPINAHGIMGKILTVSDGKITVEERNGNEQSVVINDQTVIRSNNQTATKDMLKVDAEIAVFGKPNDQGQIVADLIRIFNPNENPLP